MQINRPLYSSSFISIVIRQHIVSNQEISQLEVPVIIQTNSQLLNKSI